MTECVLIKLTKTSYDNYDRTWKYIGKLGANIDHFKTKTQMSSFSIIWNLT